MDALRQEWNIHGGVRRIIRAVDQDIPIVVVLLVPHFFPTGPALQLAKPVRAHDKDQVADLHVWDHALRFYGHHRRPGARHEEENESDTPHHGSNPEQFPRERYPGILARFEFLQKAGFLLFGLLARHD